MTLEQVYFVSQIMSAIGVLSSLIYLGLQIHNNTRELRSQGYYNAMALVQRPMEILVESESLARLINEGYASAETLSGHDWERFAYWNFLLFNGWEYLFYQARESAIPANLWLQGPPPCKAWPGALLVRIQSVLCRTVSFPRRGIFSLTSCIGRADGCID